MCLTFYLELSCLSESQQRCCSFHPFTYSIYWYCIREWRQTGGLQPGMLSSGQAVHDPLPSPTVSASRKKQKITQPVPSQSFGGPSNQPSSSGPKRGPVIRAKNKKPKSVLKSFRRHEFIIHKIYIVFSCIYCLLSS